MVQVTSFLLLTALASTSAFAHQGRNSNSLTLSNEAEAKEAELESAWSKELQEPVAYKSPIKRVVNLLEKMRAELSAEAENEAAMYDKMVCWCDTNEKEKTKAIADAEEKDTQLSQEIESRAASFGEIETEIAALKKQIAEDTETLKKATAIREKEAAEFSEEEKDMVQAVTNLKNAVNVLGKHHSGSFVQMDNGLVSGMRVMLRDLALKYELLMASDKRPSHKAPALLSMQQAGKSQQELGVQGAALLSALDIHGGHVSEVLPLKFAERVVEQAVEKKHGSNFLQSKETQPGQVQSYNSQSSGIFGILSQMLEEFQSELTAAQQAEMKAREDYAALAKSKQEQITLGKEKLDSMEEEHAANTKALSDAKENLEMTRQQRSADVEFLRNLKLTCQNIDSDWEKRSKTRTAELAAVTETIGILTEDDNREMLAKTKTTFFQVASVSNEKALRTRAADVLKSAAALPDFDTDDLLSEWHQRSGSKSSPDLNGPKAQLATLALSVQLDAFTKVKEAMDTMVKELKEEQAEEAQLKSYCNKEFDQTEKTTYTKAELKKDLEAKLESLAASIAKLAKDIEAAQVQIADTKVEIKKASQNRESENKEFQSVVADQRATQAILNKALMRLKDFYEKGIGKKVFLQKGKQTPPVQFNKYKSNSGASPVMGLLEQIIGDSKKLESEATEAEYTAQKDYEEFVTGSNKMISQLTDAVTMKTEAISSAKVETEETKGYLGETLDELEGLAKYKANLHGQCDFVLKNFDIRQKARLQEIEAIGAAKAVLSGAMA